MLVVIPARLSSTRLPQKMLLKESGKYLLQHTYEAAVKAASAERVLVATDSVEIVDAAEEFGAEVLLTSSEHTCGTERVAEVAEKFPDFEFVINLQGDEPEIDPRLIDSVAKTIEEEKVAPVVTAAAPITDTKLLTDPSVVKVVTDRDGYALYFSRSEIPYERHFSEEIQPFLAHIGIYAYKRDFLLEFVKMERTPLETVEDLEQLRVLENGYRMKVVRVAEYRRGIDTEEDYRAFLERLKGEHR